MVFVSRRSRYPDDNMESQTLLFLKYIQHIRLISVNESNKTILLIQLRRR